MERLTRASGLWSDMEPKIELVRRDNFNEALQEALRKLAKYEDQEERREST